jgi:hypothetical protein
MRVGLAVSLAGHAAILGFGLIAFPDAEPFAPEAIVALPVELVDVAEITDVLPGVETAAALPVEAPQPLTVAEVPAEAPPVPEPPPPPPEPPPPVPEPPPPPPPPPPEPAPEPSPEPAPEPLPESVPEPLPEPLPEPPVPAPAEVATLPEPVAPLPLPEPVSVPEAAAPPPDARLPRHRPAPPVAVAASQPPTPTPTPLTPPTPVAPTPVTPPPVIPEPPPPAFSADDIASLLNSETPLPGAPEEEPATIGSIEGRSDAAMTVDVAAALRARLQRCWNPSLNDAPVVVRFQLFPDGSLAGEPMPVGALLDLPAQVAAERAVRAVIQCAPYGDILRPETYDQWKEIDFNFDPREMLGFAPASLVGG